jgi:hypothetical protein
MAKFAYDKQDSVLHQFSKDIYQETKRDWLNITEQCQSQKVNPVSQIEKERISLYNPNNPLNGSRNWTKAQWEIYKKTGQSPIGKTVRNLLITSTK